MKARLLTRYESHIRPGPLNGVLVLGFCYYIAGPAALKRLVEDGALVIKIEGSPGGDPSRKVFSPGIYNTWSHGQLSMAIDSRSKEDLQLLQTLLGVVDVIVDNRSVEAQERDETLQCYLASDKPRSQIYCSINGFPADCKESKLPGLDTPVQGRTGFAYSNASSLGPLKVGVPVVDIVTGLVAAHHVTSSLYYLTRNTLPREMKNIVRINVPMAGVAMWLQSNPTIEALTGFENIREGNQDRYAVPFSYYITKNGGISIATVNDRQFENFCLHVLGNKSFHEKYSSVQKRIEYQDDFERELNELLKTQDREYWIEKCARYNIPASPLLTVSEAVQQSFARVLIKYSPDGRPLVTDGTSSFFARREKKYAGAPGFDEHGDELRSMLLSSSKAKKTSPDETIRSRL